MNEDDDDSDNYGQSVSTDLRTAYSKKYISGGKELHVVDQQPNSRAHFKKLANEGQRDGVILSSAESEYLLPHFTMLVVGKPASGKSYLIRQFLENDNFYANKFNEVFAISPSVSKLQLKIPANHMATHFSLQWIFDQFDYLNDMQLIALNQLFGKTYSQRYTQEPLTQRYGESLEKRARSAKGAALAGQVGGSLPFKSGGNLRRHADPQCASSRSCKGTLQRISQPSTGSNHGTSSLYRFVDFRQRQQYAEELCRRQEEAKECTQAYISEEDAPTYLAMLDPVIRAKFHKNVLLILDDVVGQIKKTEHHPLLAQLFMNRRHALINGTVSIILVSQKYSLIPTKVRSNANWMILFKLNPADFKFVYQDAVTFSWRTWENVVKYVFGDDSEDYNQDLISKQEQKQGRAGAQRINVREAMKAKRYDNLGIWVDYGICFKNFEKLTIN